jgi:hypothetical protein
MLFKIIAENHVKGFGKALVFTNTRGIGNE